MKLNTVVMLKDCKGCPDGVNVRPYYKGKEYNLPEDLADSFVNDLGVAHNVDANSGEISEAALKKAAEAVKAEAEKLNAAKK